MSTLTSYASAAARDSAAPAASNTGLCIFRSDTNAIEVSDGTNYQTYNSDGVIAHTFSSNTKALDFDGSNDYVSVAHSSDLSISGAMSITAWVNPDSLSGFPMFVSKRASSGHAYQFYSTSSKLNFNNGTIAQSTGTISTGSWFHVGVTFNGAGSVTFYINGSAAGTGSAATTNPTNTQAVDLGRAYNGNHFNGKMDEIAIFNTELSAPEISSIYNNKAYPPILSIWRFEDDVTDSVGSNDGTNNGATFTTTKPY
jgi:hypothetical protein